MKKKKIEKHLASALNKAPIHLYDQIKDEPVRKMDEHDFITRQEPVKTPSKYLKVLVPVVSVVTLFAVGLSIWYSQFLAIENAVFLDVNPSIEIAANKQDEVVELNGINPEGRELASGIDYEDKSLQEVTQLILDALLEQGYVTADNQTFLVSVLNEDEAVGTENSHEMNKWIQEHLQGTAIQLVVLQQSVPDSESIVEAAEAYGISTGKMAFIRNLMTLNSDFIEEELVGLSVAGLIQLAQEHKLDLSLIVEIDGDITETFEEEPVEDNVDTNDTQEESEVPDDTESNDEESLEESEIEDDFNDGAPGESENGDVDDDDLNDNLDDSDSDDDSDDNDEDNEDDLEDENT